MLADGQLTLGDRVLKHSGRKLRRLAGGVIGGFAGSTADGLTLFERLEQKIEAHPGQLRRAAVELAKAWRQDRVLRHLQATMVVADSETCLEVSGSGDVLEPSDGVHGEPLRGGGVLDPAAVGSVECVASTDAVC